MKLQANKKNTAKFTAALFALILLFPCCMDSGSSGDSGDYDSGNNTENTGSWENPNESDVPENPDSDYSANVESSVVVNLDGTCTVYVENELAGETVSADEIKELIRERNLNFAWQTK